MVAQPDRYRDGDFQHGVHHHHYYPAKFYIPSNIYSKCNKIQSMIKRMQQMYNMSEPAGGSRPIQAWFWENLHVAMATSAPQVTKEMKPRWSLLVNYLQGSLEWWIRRWGQQWFSSQQVHFFGSRFKSLIFFFSLMEPLSRLNTVVPCLSPAL